jgi:molybdopterin converting factor small subunit|tara:strand:+ start:350 stop:754 length:405 start_codon:yes stop_codon:yes gene_type:complete
MTWLVAKHAIKKSLLWVKAYWYIPAVLAYTIVMVLFFKRNSEQAGKLLDATIGSYEKQLAVLNESHQAEIGKREEILANYQKVVSELESKYAEEERQITESKKKSIKKIVEKYHDDTDGLAKEISEKFGVTYVP